MIEETIIDSEVSPTDDKVADNTALVNEIKRLNALVNVFESRYNRIHQECFNLEVALLEAQNK